ncbi:DUF6366 family protein [Desulfitobacterium hafniense]|uniref:Uncharacterized protein n=3 Tax=root TaxID=1 RepID=A0A0W1JFY7_DESHA|nr:DUF6366 family protein [Desulfitobacterium hafniense]ACL22003.1 conserved hypothetical protein [Desulfitobacterium hafniense DCB-2]KTE89983.1 hypothetical protein AT727_08625 [Desulfitobacterium hafniense]MEA5022378.1 DUF6366 family protein [Desulfitobacterium hafniense]
MDIKDEQDKHEKRKREEYEKKPMINFADSVNRAQFGDLRGLTQGGCLNQIFTTVIIIVVLFFLFQFINK